MLDFTDLSVLAEREIEELSKGMAQRLCLGRMLLHDPEVLIMDEPAAGLDPKARVEFKHLVRLLAEDGKAIFISSHILSELEHMCDSILFIGDSPNDEPMFGEFPQSIGVANLREFLGELKKLPTYITTEAFSAGFAEAVRIILDKRRRVSAQYQTS